MRNSTPSAGTFVPLAEQPNSNPIPLDEIEKDDALSGDIDIGFTFNYFGNDVTVVKASSNGYLTFNLDQDDNYFNTMGPSGSMNSLVAPLWDDLSGVNGQASYSVTGEEGSKVFAVEWLNWRWNYNGPAAVSIQVSLHQTTNEIRFTYRKEEAIPNLPSASIGIVGPASTQFFSIFYNESQTLSTAPEVMPPGYNDIVSAPATGQQYSFVPSGQIPASPTIAARNIVFGDVLPTSMNVSWINGDGDYRLVFMKQTTALESFSPQNNEMYAPSSAFGTPFSNAGNGWFCVYNGNASSATVSNLLSGFTYRIHVVEYNGLADQQQYLAQNSFENPLSSATPLIRPADLVSTLTLTYVSANTARFNVMSGSGAFRAVFMRAGNDGLAPATDLTSYLPDLAFGEGSEIGSSGWFCVFNGGSASNILVTGLQPNTAYKIHAVDYNGPAGSQLYNASSEITTKTVTTFRDVAVTYEFAASSGDFIPLEGANNLPSLEANDVLSDDAIQIGFTFYLDGVPFTQVTPSSNGFLSFNPYVRGSGNLFYDNSLEYSFARPLVAPLWDDLTGSAGQASYLTSGVSPNRVFVMEFLNWGWNYPVTSNISFQVKLYEADNSIEYVFRPEVNNLFSAAASIGLAFASVGEFVSLDGSGENPAMSLDIETSGIDGKPISGQTYRFTPSKLDQIITFDALNPIPFASPKPTIQLQGSATSGLPLVYQSGDPTVATITGTTLTVHKAGETTITASQPGSMAFNSATSIDQLLTVTVGDQTINFSAIPQKRYGEQSFLLNASSSSGLAVAYESSDPSVATIGNGNEVTITGVGTTTITAAQSGNENFNAAADVDRILTIERGDQEITFSPLDSKIKGDGPFELTAISNIGLVVSFESSNSQVATIEGNIVTITGHGIAEITASQAGNSLYNAAPLVTQMLLVRSSQSIDFPEISMRTLDAADFVLNPTATSGLPVQLSSPSSNITLNNGTVSLVSPGRATVTAEQSGDQIFLAAPAVERTFCVVATKPAITVSGLGSEAPVLTSSATSHNQWFKDGIALEGQTNPSLTATSAGNYTVKVIVDDCESESSDAESLIVTGIGVEQNPIIIYPNPASQEIMIDVRGLYLQTEVPVGVIDLNGKKVAESSVRTSTYIDVSKLAIGTYLVRIKHGDQIISKTFIKE